jgi:hypothetical protein
MTSAGQPLDLAAFTITNVSSSLLIPASRRIPTVNLLFGKPTAAGMFPRPA